MTSRIGQVRGAAATTSYRFRRPHLFGLAGSDALFEESFDDATGFTIASGTFFSDGGG